MATATPPPQPRSMPFGSPQPSGFLDRFEIVSRAIDAVYRFLASLQLAVICLTSLAATLAWATWYNSQYGMNAAGEDVYQSIWFKLLLGFLAANVFCAALIRFPWTKRQTGFVITHVGLLVVIGGSFWGSLAADEGMLGMLEGETSSKLIRNHKPVIFVKPIDPHTMQSKGEYEISVKPGHFDWAEGRTQLVTRPSDPFQLTIKKYFAASSPSLVVKEDPAGRPFLQIRPKVIPPRQKDAVDVFPDPEDRWIGVRSSRVPRNYLDQRPARFVFSRPESSNAFKDFNDPPAEFGLEGVARIHYVDRAGAPRRFDARIDDLQKDVFFPLPDSDLQAAFKKVSHSPIADERGQEMMGADSLDLVQFAIKRGDGPAIEHNAYAQLPDVPAVMPAREGADQDRSVIPPEPLASIVYDLPPVVDPQAGGLFGVVEVMADHSGKLGYRVYQRGNPGKLRGHGPIEPGKVVIAFGGDELSPMTMTFSIEKYLERGRKVEEAVSITDKLQPSQRDDAIPAMLAEIKVGDQSRDVWLRKSPDFDINYKTVAFGDKLFEVAYDVDRVDLGFSLKLTDFDVGFDPGTRQASSFKSEVLLTDPSAEVKDQPHSIYMNHTLDYKGWRFFQSNYTPKTDKETGQKTGEFISVFQVAKTPARGVIYAGCYIVVLGAFVQFYMRAGLFTDGGKLQQKRDAEKARKRLEALARKSGQPAKPPRVAKGPSISPDDEPL